MTTGKHSITTIRYSVRVGSKTLVYRIDPHGGPLQTRPDAVASAPDWTQLDFHQCPNCPLRAAEHAHCPAAQQIAPLLPDWGDLSSHQQVRATVTTDQRTVTTDTSAQQVLASLLGLVLALSDCPVTAFLRPMARFHLPFASQQETLFRSVSAYLLRQYFRRRRGAPVDLALSGLIERYRALEIVNQSLAERLRAASSRDAAINAIALLCCTDICVIIIIVAISVITYIPSWLYTRTCCTYSISISIVVSICIIGVSINRTFFIYFFITVVIVAIT